MAGHHRADHYRAGFTCKKRVERLGGSGRKFVCQCRNGQIVVMADKWELVNGRRLHLLLPYPWVHLEE